MRNSHTTSTTVTSLIGFILLVHLTLEGTAQSESTKRGWWPQSYSVSREEPGTLVLSTPFYSIEHDLEQGGAIKKIVLTHGKADNLLLKPLETHIRLLSTPSVTQTPVKDIYRDTLDTSPSVSHTSSGKTEVVTVSSRLINEEGLSSGVTVKTTYTYRWGYIRVRKEISTTENPVKVRSLNILSSILHPTLTDYGYRPAVSEEMGPSPHSWQNGQIRRWGKIRPGTHFDLPFRTRYVPRYLVLANHGIEGIEWFCADKLSQWDYQMTGQPGNGYCELRPVTNPLGVAISVFPLNLSQNFNLQQGGWVSLEGTYIFDYYIGIPVLEGHAHNPWLNKGYRALGGNWVSEEGIRKNAENGVVTMHLHNDGDHEKDGLFWRDGSYPPYPPEEMEKMEQAIELIHKYGMKTTPYFSNHEFHQSNNIFWEMANQWGRKPDDQGNIRPNYYYGAHMCLKSGWLDYFKSTVDRVLDNHDFDGVYYDWNIAMFCNNPLHMNETTTGVPEDSGLGALSLSPTGHWDVDELVEMVEWTRERVGPDGVVMLHNTLAPMFATENFANYVVGMEFSYGKLSVSVPRPEELPLEWNFAGARPRGVIGYGTIAGDAPQRLHKAYAMTTLLTSVAPWPVSSEALELYKILQPLGDLEQYRFEDWRNQVVELDNADCSSAVYSRKSEAFLLVANLSPEGSRVTLGIDPTHLPFPLQKIQNAEIIAPQNDTRKLSSEQLQKGSETLEISADTVVLIRLN